MKSILPKNYYKEMMLSIFCYMEHLEPEKQNLPELLFILLILSLLYSEMKMKFLMKKQKIKFFVELIVY